MLVSFWYQTREIPNRIVSHRLYSPPHSILHPGLVPSHPVPMFCFFSTPYDQIYAVCQDILISAPIFCFISTPTIGSRLRFPAPFCRRCCIFVCVIMLFVVFLLLCCLDGFSVSLYYFDRRCHYQYNRLRHHAQFFVSFSFVAVLSPILLLPSLLPLLALSATTEHFDPTTPFVFLLRCVVVSSS